MGDMDCGRGLKDCDVIGGLELVWSRERRFANNVFLYYFSLVGTKIN
jgi:hypothetical protein